MQTAQNPNRHREINWVAVSVVPITALLAYVCRLDFVPKSTADDSFYNYFSEPIWLLALGNAVNGRYASAALTYALDKTGADFSLVLTLLKFANLALFSTCAFLFVLLLTGARSWLASVVFCAIFILHPYHTTSFDNSINQPNMFVALCAVNLAIVCHATLRGLPRFLACAVLLIIAAMGYQIFCYFFAVFVIAHSLFRDENATTAASNIAQGFGAIVVAMACYVIAVKVLNPWVLQAVQETNEPLFIQYNSWNQRSGLRDISELPGGVHIYILQMARSLFMAEEIIPGFAKFLLVTTLGLPLVIWQWQRHGPNPPAHSRLKFYLLVMLLLACGSPMHVLLEQMNSPPRIVMHVAAVLAVIFLFGWFFAPPTLRKVTLLLGCLAAVTLGYLSFDIARHHQEVTKRDRLKIVQIAQELRGHPQFTRETGLHVFGSIDLDSPHMRGIKTSFAINVSKLHATWGLLPLISEAIGRKMMVPSHGSRQMLDQLCRSTPLGANLYTLLFKNGDAVLCLDNERDSLHD